MKNKLENSYKIKIGGSKMLDIKRIREKLQDETIIKTVRGLGYRIGD